MSLQWWFSIIKLTWIGCKPFFLLPSPSTVVINHPSQLKIGVTHLRIGENICYNKLSLKYYLFSPNWHSWWSIFPCYGQKTQLSQHRLHNHLGHTLFWYLSTPGDHEGSWPGLNWHLPHLHRLEFKDLYHLKISICTSRGWRKWLYLDKSVRWWQTKWVEVSQLNCHSVAFFNARNLMRKISNWMAPIFVRMGSKVKILFICRSFWTLRSECTLFGTSSFPLPFFHKSIFVHNAL